MKKALWSMWLLSGACSEPASDPSEKTDSASESSTSSTSSTVTATGTSTTDPSSTTVTTPTEPCEAPGTLTTPTDRLDLFHWQGETPTPQAVALEVTAPPCEAFVAQGNPSWVVPELTPDGASLTVSIDPEAIPASGVHTGYVSLRDASDATVLVEIEVGLRALLSPAKPTRKAALVIGVDGLDGEELTKIDAPHLDLLKRGGAQSDAAHTMLEASTMSGPGWTSILTGVDASKHNVWSNGAYEGRDTAYPSFSWRAKHLLGLSTAASIQWTDIYDIYEDDALDVAYTGNMEEVADQMSGALRSGLHDVHFVHLDDVDGAGHGHGFYASVPEYVEAVHRADALIGELLDAVLHRPDIADEEWLIVVTSDHGGQGTSHGCMEPDCQTIPLIFAGASISTETFGDGASSHMDIAPTVLDFLGLNPDEHVYDGVSWISRERDCEDGADDDGDGAIDCADPDCNRDLACLTCPSEDLGSVVGNHVWSGVAATGGVLTGSCGGDGYEVSFGWTAPAAGWYSFDTTGVYEDTVLYLLDGDCDGAELACNDDVVGTRSGLAVELADAQAVTVVVDAAAAGDAIDAMWSVYPFDATCGHDDLGTDERSWSGTVPMTNTAWIGGGCPPAVGGALLTWTAPTSGLYTFSTAGSGFDTVLYVLSSCDGPDATLACNDDAGAGYQSEVELAVSEGSQVVVVVGAFDARYDAGDYTLTITR